MNDNLSFIANSNFFSSYHSLSSVIYLDTDLHGECDLQTEVLVAFLFSILQS